MTPLWSYLYVGGSLLLSVPSSSNTFASDGFRAEGIAWPRWVRRQAAQPEVCAAPAALTVSAAPPTGRRKIHLWSSPGRRSRRACCLFFLRNPCSDGSCFEVITSQSRLVCRCTLRSSQRVGRWADCRAVAKVVGSQCGGVSGCPGTVCGVRNTAPV